MEIQYLELLRDTPTKINGYTNEGISLAEIQVLEQVYNSGNPFPKVLKELLYLAGEYCTVLAYWGGIIVFLVI